MAQEFCDFVTQPFRADSFRFELLNLKNSTNAMNPSNPMNPTNPSNSMDPTNPIPGLYIHIPFCLSKCDYCDFYSSTSISALPGFLEALFKEMELYRPRFQSFDPSTALNPAHQTRDKGTLRVNPEPLDLGGSTELAEVSGRRQALQLWTEGSRGVDTVYIGGGT